MLDVIMVTVVLVDGQQESFHSHLCYSAFDPWRGKKCLCRRKKLIARPCQRCFSHRAVPPPVLLSLSPSRLFRPCNHFLLPHPEQGPSQYHINLHHVWKLFDLITTPVTEQTARSGKFVLETRSAYNL